jgi:hypothetical protein
MPNSQAYGDHSSAKPRRINNLLNNPVYFNRSGLVRFLDGRDKDAASDFAILHPTPRPSKYQN